MNLELVNMEELSVAELLKGGDSLYYICSENSSDQPLGIYRSDSIKPDFTVVGMLRCDFEEKSRRRFLEDKSIEVVETKLETSEPVIDISDPNIKVDWWNTHRPERNYTCTAWSRDGMKHVSYTTSKGHQGVIRCSFQEKEDAEVYFDIFRENFYKRHSKADVITVCDIYRDMDIDTDKYAVTEAQRWGWYTLESGVCKYMLTDKVTKSRVVNGFGFTIDHPELLYDHFGQPLF